MSRYTITAGQSNVTKVPSASRMILDGITKDEQLVAAWRRRQAEIDEKLTVQADWLRNMDNRHDPRYEQRQHIHDDRHQERHELEMKSLRLIETIDGHIETLDGSEREEAVRRLLSWTEPPF
jgi:hypothetical protein